MGLMERPDKQQRAAYQCAVCQIVRAYGFDDATPDYQPLLRCVMCATRTRHAFVGQQVFTLFCDIRRDATGQKLIDCTFIPEESAFTPAAEMAR